MRLIEPINTLIMKRSVTYLNLKQCCFYWMRWMSAKNVSIPLKSWTLLNSSF